MDFNIIKNNLDFCYCSKRKINEEETKMYLIYPFFEYLGYSIFSPQDIVFEYVCDMHEKGNRRVDFAIMDNDKPLIIIEAKPFGEQLNSHWGQIKSYFISSGANYAVLTDGVKYHVFEKEQIDSNYSHCTPKYEFELDKLNLNNYDTLRKLSKINLKPLITDTDTNKNDNTIAQEDKVFNAFCKTISRSDVIDSTTSSLYDRFLDFCKKNNSQATSKIAFSKKTNKFFNTRVVSKRFGNTVVRVFVANQ